MRITAGNNLQLFPVPYAQTKGNTMTRRTMILFFLALLAASPLIWMSVDPNAGNTLLSLTGGAKAQVSVVNVPPR